MDHGVDIDLCYINIDSARVLAYNVCMCVCMCVDFIIIISVIVIIY
jgi:hypothetical protein